jgi:hypothetical protein
VSAELGFGRLLDYGVIMPRLQRLYEWSARELDIPGLLDCCREGALTYAWAFEDRAVWQAPRSLLVPVVHRALPIDGVVSGTDGDAQDLSGHD